MSARLALAAVALAALAAAAALAGGTGLAGCASRPRCTIDVPRGPSPPPFLWRVQRGDGPVVWLYGTIHHAGAGDVPAAAWAALDGAPRFVSELGEQEPDPDRVRELAFLRAGAGLDHQLSSDDWYDLRDALRGAVKEDDLRRARPWFAMARLTATVARGPSPNMDEALTRRAAARRIPIAHLETWAEQLTALADAVQLADLVEALRARHRMACELAGMRAFYAAGDLDAMHKLLVGARSPALLDARNRRWLPVLEPYLASGGAFVAVGLGHLLGDAGLPALLARAGYTVERAR